MTRIAIVEDEAAVREQLLSNLNLEATEEDDL